VVTLESDLESTASIGTNSSRKTYESIPKPILKQLFYDIEHAGGLHEFDKGVKQGLNVLLDKGDPGIYGERGDKVRRRLSVKVSDWKKLTRTQYHKRLFKLGIQPADTLLKSDIVSLKEKDPPKKKKKQGAIRPIPEDSVPDEILAPVHAPDRVANPPPAASNIPTKSKRSTMKGARILFE
jgi:hypothetical protein